MSLKIGTSNIADVYAGSTKISAIYKGSALVYSSGIYENLLFSNLYHSLIPSTIDTYSITEKNKAKLSKIYANGVIENQLIQNGNFEGDTGWVHDSSSSFTITNGVVKITVTANGYGSGLQQTTTNYCINGHKYFIFALCRTSDSTVGMRFTQYSYGAGATILSSGNVAVGTSWKQYTVFATASGTGSGSTTWRPACIRSNGTSVADDWLEIKNLNVIDLTLMFGTGNEPTTLTDNRIQALLNRGYIEYNTGGYKGTDIGEFVSVGRNLCDKTTFSQYGYSSDYKKFNSNNAVFLKAGTYTYTFKSTGGDFYMQFFNSADSNDYLLVDDCIASGTPTFGKWWDNRAITLNDAQYRYFTFTLKRDCYITICGKNADNIECMIAIGSSILPYTPYKTLSPLLFKYQGNGAINTHDTLEITNTEWVFTKNVNSVDLGTLNWTPRNSDDRYGCAYAYPTNLKYPSSNNNVANICCVNYPTTTFQNLFYTEGSSTTFKGIASSIANLEIKDPTFRNYTGEQIKTAMSGVMLYYELATPQVIRIPRKHLAVVDLGDISWTYDNEANHENMFSPVIEDIKKPSANSVVANVVCYKYTSVSRNDLYSHTQKNIIAIQNNGRIRIYADDMGTNATDFKNAMSGVYLFYETQDEVADIPFEIGVEAGGTLSPVWFEWVKNQIAVLSRTSATIRDITFTSNGDNDLSVSGTSQQDENFVVGIFNNISGHKYLARTIFLSGKPTNSSGYFIKWKTVNYGKDIGNGIIFTGTATESSYIIFAINSANIAIDCRFRLQLIDLTLAFGSGNEPTDVSDPRVQAILNKGYIAYDATGTVTYETPYVLPNLDALLKCK